MTKKKMDVRELVLCGIFTALIAVGAFIRVPLPLIPFTLQVFFVVMAGYVLGARLAAISTGLYVAMGLLGIPIFTEGGGFGYVLRPTFGYLIGFIVAAYAVGRIAHGGALNLPRLLAAALVGLAISYSFGCVYCYFIANFVLGVSTGAWAVFLSGCVLVFPGNAVCCVIGALLARRILPHLPYLDR